MVQWAPPVCTRAAPTLTTKGRAESARRDRMLNYVATANHRYTIDVLLRDWAPELRPHFRVLSYEQLTSERVLPEGRWVLTDFERLRGPLPGFATAMYRVLRRS